MSYRKQPTQLHTHPHPVWDWDRQPCNPGKGENIPLPWVMCRIPDRATWSCTSKIAVAILRGPDWGLGSCWIPSPPPPQVSLSIHLLVLCLPLPCSAPILASGHWPYLLIHGAGCRGKNVHWPFFYYIGASTLYSVFVTWLDWHKGTQTTIASKGFPGPNVAYSSTHKPLQSLFMHLC